MRYRGVASFLFILLGGISTVVFAQTISVDHQAGFVLEPTPWDAVLTPGGNGGTDLSFSQPDYIGGHSVQMTDPSDEMDLIILRKKLSQQRQNPVQSLMFQQEQEAAGRDKTVAVSDKEGVNLTDAQILSAKSKSISGLETAAIDVQNRLFLTNSHAMDVKSSVALGTEQPLLSNSSMKLANASSFPILTRSKSLRVTDKSTFGRKNDIQEIEQLQMPISSSVNTNIVENVEMLPLEEAQVKTTIGLVDIHTPQEGFLVVVENGEIKDVFSVVKNDDGTFQKLVSVKEIEGLPLELLEKQITRQHLDDGTYIISISDETFKVPARVRLTDTGAYEILPVTEKVENGTYIARIEQGVIQHMESAEKQNDGTVVAVITPSVIPTEAVAFPVMVDTMGDLKDGTYVVDVQDNVVSKGESVKQIEEQIFKIQKTTNVPRRKASGTVAEGVYIIDISQNRIVSSSKTQDKGTGHFEVLEPVDTVTLTYALPKIVQEMTTLKDGTYIVVVKDKMITVARPAYWQGDKEVTLLKGQTLGKEQSGTIIKETAEEPVAKTMPSSTESEAVATTLEGDENVQILPLGMQRLQLGESIQDWEARPGDTLRNLLTDWGSRSGWTVIWGLERDYHLEAGVVFRGRFVDIAGAIIRTFARAVPAPIGTFYKGNRVLVINAQEEENGY